jgi:hypothetical protein
MILCDTNILIDIYRKNIGVIASVNEILRNDEIVISDVTRAEMLVGARNKREMQILFKELSQIKNLPLRPDISELSIPCSHNIACHTVWISTMHLLRRLLFVITLHFIPLIVGILYLFPI